MKSSFNQVSELATPFASVAEQSTLNQSQPDWLKALRQNAFIQFNTSGFPTKKVEDWKYTSLWSLSQQQFEHQAQATKLSVVDISQATLLEDAYRIVIVDGKFKAEYSTLTALQTGLKIKPFSVSGANLEHCLGQQVDMAKPGLTALNTLLMSDGVVIEIEADVELKKPIELLHIQTGETQNLAVHLRNVIVLAENSKASFIEHYVGLSEAVSMTNVVTEVSVAENADLTHYKLQKESINAYHIATLAAKQATNSDWHTYNISLGASLARNDIHSQLLGEQAHVTMNGLYFANKTQHIDNHTLIDHTVPNTTSSELYKGILDDTSHAVFNGKVIVHKDAQKTDANQSNHNLLLSRGCEIDTKPEMEIHADDVKCAHGSTVGQINDDQLFFLRTRGLDETNARSLLTFAFAAEVLENIPSETIKQAMSVVIEQRLPRGGA